MAGKPARSAQVEGPPDGLLGEEVRVARVAEEAVGEEPALVVAQELLPAFARWGWGGEGGGV